MSYEHKMHPYHSRKVSYEVATFQRTSLDKLGFLQKSRMGFSHEDGIRKDERKMWLS